MPVTRELFPFDDVIMRSERDRWLWMHQRVMTSEHGIVFRITDPLWVESVGDRWIPLTKRQICWALMFAFNKWLNKQLSCRWFETPRFTYDIHRNLTHTSSLLPHLYHHLIKMGHLTDNSSVFPSVIFDRNKTQACYHHPCFYSTCVWVYRRCLLVCTV